MSNPGPHTTPRATCSCGRAEVELGCDLCAYCRDDYERRQWEREQEDVVYREADRDW